MEGLNYFERCNVLNLNAVLLARHFQQQVEIFFREILLIGSGPFGKVQYYTTRLELKHHSVKTFQIHCHSKTCHAKNMACRFKFGRFLQQKP